MRELKFRGKSTADGAWAYGSNVVRSAQHDLHSFFHVAAMGEIDESTIEQYTGLKDKNGVEICEGDIVRYDDPWYSPTESNDPTALGTVVWDTAQGAWRVRDYRASWELGDEIADACVVIGNIHENPELIPK